MKPTISSFGIDRRALLSALAVLPAFSSPLVTASAQAQTATSTGVLPSWNEGAAKQAIVDFVRTTTDRASPTFVSPEERIAAFDQDGWTGAAAGARLKVLLLHNDATREYAYGPAHGLPNSKVGTFTPALYDEAKKNSWTVISMKNDWKRIFSFD